LVELFLNFDMAETLMMILAIPFMLVIFLIIGMMCGLILASVQLFCISVLLAFTTPFTDKLFAITENSKLINKILYTLAIINMIIFYIGVFYYNIFDYGNFFL